MNKKEEQTHSLYFDNMEVLTPKQSVSSCSVKVESNWTPSWENILRYFLEYKTALVATSVLIPILLFSLFQNRVYKATVGFKIEPGQDLTSNILSDSILGIRSNKNSLDNIPERALAKASSMSFYQELTDIVISEQEYDFIKFKLGEERKGWVEFVKKKLLGKIQLSGQEQIHSRISEQLEQVITVKKKGENNILFTVGTKNIGLTKDIQKLIKDQSAKLLVKDPLAEAKGALKIIEDSESAIFEELDNLDSRILNLQSEFKTLIPQELPARYSSMRLEIEKGILKNVTQERQLQKKIKQLTIKSKKDQTFDYSIEKEKEELLKELTGLKAGTKHLTRSLATLESEYKELPEFSSKIEKYTLRKKILLEKLNKLTEQISLAKISYEKVKTSITNLNTNEKIQVTSTLKILVKTLIVSLTLIGMLIAGLYYKQSLFPVLMSKNQLVLPENSLAVTIPKISSRRDSHITDNHPRKIALENFYNAQISSLKWISITSISKNPNMGIEVKSLLEIMLARGKKVILIKLDEANFEKKHVKRLKKAYAKDFEFIELNSKSYKNEFPNKRAIRKVMNSHAESDHLVVLTDNLDASPDGLIMSQMVEKAFIFAEMFKTTEKNIKKFNKRKAELASQLKNKFHYVLTNAQTYDDLNSFIYPNGDSSEKDSPLQEAA